MTHSSLFIFSSSGADCLKICLERMFLAKMKQEMRKKQPESFECRQVLSDVFKALWLQDGWFVYVKRTCKICVAVFLCIKMISIFNYIYVDGEPWYRILWHHYYEDEGRIDQICLGSSHVYCDINPSLLDAVDGAYHFNMASPEQQLNGSYYLLKEAVQGNRISHVYLELYYIISSKENFNGDIDPICDTAKYSYNWQNTDFMKLSWNRFAYMRAIGGMENYPEIFLPFSRYRSKLEDWDYVRQTIEKKKDLSYKAYEYRYDYEDGNGYYKYCGQGYLYSTRELLEEQRLFRQSVILGENPLGEMSEGYIRKIISFCKKESVPITLFISPIDDLQLLSTEGYDHYISQIRRIAEEYRVDFYDFNLAKEDFLPVRDGKYFQDVGHLNSVGADLYTPFFYKVVLGEEENNKKYFYASYKEKLEATAPAIYGLYYRDMPATEESPQSSRRYVIASNRMEGMEYSVSVKPNEGEEYMVQKFGLEKSFVLPVEQRGVCTVTCRKVDGDGALIQEIKVNY